MERRALLSLIATTTGMAFVGSNSVFAWEPPASATPVEDSGLSKRQYKNISAVCDTLLPRTDTPGAVDAGVPALLVAMVNDCYTKEQKALFLEGLADISERSKNQHSRDYHELSADEQLDLIRLVDQEAIAFNKGKRFSWKNTDPSSLPHYFTLIKQWVIFCFFNSKVGGTQVLRHVPVPGKYEDIPYKKGDGAWAAIYPW